jgi:hypothetical protein
VITIAFPFCVNLLKLHSILAKPTTKAKLLDKPNGTVAGGKTPVSIHPSTINHYRSRFGAQTGRAMKAKPRVKQLASRGRRTAPRRRT